MRMRLPAATMATAPGVTKSCAPPSSVATSTAPSSTCTDVPAPDTPTEKVVPFTTAARYGVFTSKCGVIFFLIMKTTLPSSSITRVTPAGCASAGRRRRDPGATIMNSVPRTSTARPPRPVDTTSPALTAPPRVATVDTPARAIVTGPDASLIVQPAGPARACVEQDAASKTARARRIENLPQVRPIRRSLRRLIALEGLRCCFMLW